METKVIVCKMLCGWIKETKGTGKYKSFADSARGFSKEMEEKHDTIVSEIWASDIISHS